MDFPTLGVKRIRKPKVKKKKRQPKPVAFKEIKIVKPVGVLPTTPVMIP